VRVAVDVPALADQRRELDYVAPAGTAVGSVVRVPLHGRRAGGWVVGTDIDPDPGLRLARVAKVSGYGPAPEVVELTAWGAWRWAGRRTALLRAASPPAVVRGIPPAGAAVRGRAPEDAEAIDMARDARLAGEAVVRVPPAADPSALVSALLGAGPALVVVGAAGAARPLADRLRAAGWPTALLPEGWARAAGGGTTVVGARATAWAPASGIETIVVLDAHDHGLVETRAPTWSAWVVAAERARRLGLPCVLVTPCPRLEQLQWGRLLVPSRDSERRGWAPVVVLDRTRDDPREGLLGERLVPVLREATAERPVVCVLNRTGRVRSLACRTCGWATVCEHCGGGMGADGAGLTCHRCHRIRPAVCQHCGSAALKATRLGVTRLRDDLEALARLPVAEITAATDTVPRTPVVIGTEAALHRVRRAAAVVLLDFDGELLAPRMHAAEDALALLALASRQVGGRDAGGRVLVQTRQPDHPVVQAAVRADPGRLAESELSVRAALALPPFTALAEITGEPALVEAAGSAVAGRHGAEVVATAPGRVLVRARDHRALCDALAEGGRPPGVGIDRLRIDVDPLRI